MKNYLLFGLFSLVFGLPILSSCGSDDKDGDLFDNQNSRGTHYSKEQLYGIWETMFYDDKGFVILGCLEFMANGKGEVNEIKNDGDVINSESFSWELISSSSIPELGVVDKYVIVLTFQDGQKVYLIIEKLTSTNLQLASETGGTVLFTKKTHKK
ncbi:MAG: hypothetical protein SPK85_02785 [Prevotella sp.]|nr:hypothetical protein [Prevotella sp.]